MKLWRLVTPRGATAGQKDKGPAGSTSSGDRPIVEFPINVIGDPLADFDSEGEAEAQEEHVRPTRAQAQTGSQAIQPLHREGKPLSLDQVLERSNGLLWVEAVAIVDALCTILRGEDDERQSVPEYLSEISITSHGSVLARRGKAGGAPGPRLARILLTLTASANVPVPLRLFITRWASLDDSHSIADYARELAHFARPDGQALIQAVYERCLTAAPPPQVQLERVVTPAADRLSSLANSKRHIRFAAGAAGVSALAAAAAWLWTGSSLWESPLDSRQVTLGAPAVAPTVHRDEPGAAWLVAARLGETVPPSSLADSSPSLRVETRSPTAVPVDNAPVRRFAELPRLAVPAVVPALPVAADLPRSGVGEGRTGSATATPSAAPARTATEIPDRSLIYSSADADVRPPVIIDASLPAPLLSGTSEINTMELVISARGDVERVRLVSQPRRMADMMLLSGAKNWKFEPASLDGRSVRYRLRLSWAATP